VVSSWLPLNSWVWIAGSSLWFAVALLVLPGVFRWRRYGWHQAFAAVGFALFLLSIPALWGAHTRTRLGFILLNNTPLRLTPTAEGQEALRLNGGDPVRWEKKRGDFVLVRTANSRGWILSDEMGLLTQQPK
jgi:hypothetical protein